jgi:hypothetical protein
MEISMRVNGTMIKRMVKADLISKNQWKQFKHKKDKNKYMNLVSFILVNSLMINGQVKADNVKRKKF